MGDAFFDGVPSLFLPAPDTMPPGTGR